MALDSAAYRVRFIVQRADKMNKNSHKNLLMIAGLIATSAAVSGCMRTTGALENLPPQPTGNVQSSQLTPVGSPQGTPLNSANGQFASTQLQQGQQAVQGVQQDAAQTVNTALNSEPIERGTVAGVWNVQVAGNTCRFATSFTRRSAHYQASALRCPNPELAAVREWNVSGNQLVLYDQSGSAIARLFKTAEQRFDGKTSSGVAVTFSRS